MNCTLCQGIIYAGENYCADCGWPQVTCTKCHKPFPVRSSSINFCPHCGEKMYELQESNREPKTSKPKEISGSWLECPEPKSQGQIPDPFHFGYQEAEKPENQQEMPSIAGGISEIHIPAKDYGPFDLKRGFTTVDEARQKMEMVLKCLISDDEGALLAFLDLAFPPFPDQ